MVIFLFALETVYPEIYANIKYKAIFFPVLNIMFYISQREIEVYF